MQRLRQLTVSKSWPRDAEQAPPTAYSAPAPPPLRPLPPHAPPPRPPAPQRGPPQRAPAGGRGGGLFGRLLRLPVAALHSGARLVFGALRMGASLAGYLSARLLPAPVLAALHSAPQPPGPRLLLRAPVGVSWAQRAPGALRQRTAAAVNPFMIFTMR